MITLTDLLIFGESRASAELIREKARNDIGTGNRFPGQSQQHTQDRSSRPRSNALAGKAQSIPRRNQLPGCDAFTWTTPLPFAEARFEGTGLTA
jgi:hypothetical protein